MLLGLPRVLQLHPARRGSRAGIGITGDYVTAAGEAITMWARVVLPARHGAGWPSPKSQHGLGRQEGLMS
jgi:hypothetical protein